MIDIPPNSQHQLHVLRPIIVTLFACIAHKFVSSNSLRRNASAASCKANTVAGVRHISHLMFCRISLTSWRNGSFQISNSIDIWNWLICLGATVPVWNLCGLFSPPVAGVPLFCISFVMKCFAPSLFSDHCLLCSSHFLITNWKYIWGATS